jgi:hypothetical protein
MRCVIMGSMIGLAIGIKDGKLKGEEEEGGCEKVDVAKREERELSGSDAAVLYVESAPYFMQ